MHNTKKSFILRLISAVIMTLMLAFLLSGCTHKKVTQTDITVTPDDESYEYSEASVSYAQNAVYSCLYAYEKEKSGAPNQEKINSLKKQAEKILEDCERLGVSVRDYMLAKEYTTEARELPVLGEYYCMPYVEIDMLDIDKTLIERFEYSFIASAKYFSFTLPTATTLTLYILLTFYLLN